MTAENTSQPTDLNEETPAITLLQQPEKGLLRVITSLRQRNFRLFWCGQMISLIGSYMQSIGETWLVLELTHSAWQLGLVGALQAVPILLFSIFGALASVCPGAAAGAHEQPG